MAEKTSPVVELRCRSCCRDAMYRVSTCGEGYPYQTPSVVKSNGCRRAWRAIPLRRYQKEIDVYKNEK
ncbi:MAG: hypothetical protein LBL33_08980 [Tannerella sp.]|nr:hypothetical protein [Tannerella sp.]